MGLFDRIEKAATLGNKTEWKLGRKPAIITLNDNHIDIKHSSGEVQIFYEDIQQIERVRMKINIKTMPETYTLSPINIREGMALAEDLHAQLLDKIANHKSQQTNQSSTNTDGNTPSFCGNCGQPLSGENFCPSCGTEVKKI